MTTQETLLQKLLNKIEGLEKQINVYPPPNNKLLTNLQESKSENRLLVFTEKEIIQMPKSFRKTFRVQGCTAHIRKRITGRYTCSYEIRYAKKPYDKRPISASGTTIELAKKRFIEKLNNYIPPDDTIPTIPTLFDGFAMYWFENFHKRKVGNRTYDHDIKLYNRHIKERFGKFKVNAINPAMIQMFLDDFSDRPKTAKDLYSILNQILSMAVKHGLIKLNPIGMCFINSYEQEHGTLITKEEETKLLNALNGTPYQLYVAVTLYTGLRPNEYATSTIENGFIKAVNSKRHSKKVEYKYIPITPMLRPYLVGVSELNMPNDRMINNRFKKVLPNHKLYDMRTTFQTRCSECGIPDNVIGVFMGNSIGKLKEAYTDFSKDYLLKEAEKFKY